MPEGKPWGFASYECKKLDAHLPVIRSAIENKKITKLIQDRLKTFFVRFDSPTFRCRTFQSFWKSLDLRIKGIHNPVTWIGIKKGGFPTVNWMEHHSRKGIHVRSVLPGGCDSVESWWKRICRRSWELYKLERRSSWE